MKKVVFALLTIVILSAGLFVACWRPNRIQIVQMQPVDKAIDVSVDIILKWNYSYPGAEFDVYFGEVIEETAGRNMNRVVSGLKEKEYKPELELLGGRTYNWQVCAFIGGKEKYRSPVMEFRTIEELLTVEATPAARGDVRIGTGAWGDNWTQKMKTGDLARIEAMASGDNVFTGWFENGVRISMDNPYVFRVNSHRNINANFSENVEISFEDTELENTVRNASGYTGNSSGPIYLKDVFGIDDLNTNYKNITSLNGIENILNLRVFSCVQSNIRDLTQLSGLINLEYLYLMDNLINDITPLSNLTNLFELYIDNNQFSDITSLSNLKKLRELYFNTNQVVDISVLSNFKELRKLSLYSNHVMDITILSNLNNLAYFNFASNTVSNINPLTNLINLDTINLAYNTVSDITSLVNNVGLTTNDNIDMRNNNLDLTAGSEDMQNIQALIDRGIVVLYQ